MTMVDRRLADQIYEDRRRELRLKGWTIEDATRQAQKELTKEW